MSRTVPQLIGLLVGHVGRVRDCQLLAEEGLSAREAASRLKRHPFYVEKLYAQSRNYGTDELRGADRPAGCSSTMRSRAARVSPSTSSSNAR